MCKICRYYLYRSDARSRQCKGVHYCWGGSLTVAGGVCGGRVQGQGLPSYVSCSNGHGSVGLVVRKGKPPWNSTVSADGPVRIPKPEAMS